MTQKIIKVGSSAAVTISKHALEELGLGIGDRIIVAVDSNRKKLVVESATSIVQPDKELIEWTQGFFKTYRAALEALAKK